MLKNIAQIGCRDYDISAAKFVTIPMTHCVYLIQRKVTVV